MLLAMHSPLRTAIPVDTLLLAYRSGIFPMADKREDKDIFWVEPRERAILPLDLFHVSKSLRKVLRADRFIVTIDAAFGDVIRACAEPRPGHPETWISDRIVRSYENLHAAGHAHSIECWRASDPEKPDPGPPQLVGGLYGVAFDRVFCGESMFSRVDNASKVALAWLVALMRRARYRLPDCQFMTSHLASMGAIEMPQRMYLEAVELARGKPAMSLVDAYRDFTDDAVRDPAAGWPAAGIRTRSKARQMFTGMAEGFGRTQGPAAARSPGEGNTVQPSSAASSADASGSSPGKRIAQSLTQTS
jgi:leucyl/phenylalanyl-tRNA--protein transferase